MRGCPHFVVLPCLVSLMHLSTKWGRCQIWLYWRPLPRVPVVSWHFQRLDNGNAKQGDLKPNSLWNVSENCLSSEIDIHKCIYRNMSWCEADLPVPDIIPVGRASAQMFGPGEESFFSSFFSQKLLLLICYMITTKALAAVQWRELLRSLPCFAFALLCFHSDADGGRTDDGRDVILQLNHNDSCSSTKRINTLKSIRTVA